MNFRNISSWCIRNPVPPIVLFIGLLLAGIVSFTRMDVNSDPDIDFPVIIVMVNQPGAAPVEMENQITQRVEAAIRSVGGVNEIDSTVNEGDESVCAIPSRSSSDSVASIASEPAEYCSSFSSDPLRNERTF